jgi:hypothetical protein
LETDDLMGIRIQTHEYKVADVMADRGTFSTKQMDHERVDVGVVMNLDGPHINFVEAREVRRSLCEISHFVHLRLSPRVGFTTGNAVMTTPAVPPDP